MPFLRSVDSPPFELVNDIMDVVDQLLKVSIAICGLYILRAHDRLKGLVFLHGVAHRYAYCRIIMLSRLSFITL